MLSLLPRSFLPCLAIAATFLAEAQAQTTTRVSVDSAGQQGNDTCSYSCSISNDGRFVVFSSKASNLVAADTNGTYDIFVHDRLTGQTSRASVDSTGGEGNSYSTLAHMSANGRYVVFDSNASNLVPNDMNGFMDTFVHDRLTGQTVRVSMSSSGTEGNRGSADPFISPDGRYISFQSNSSNLVPGDTNGQSDIFLHDRQTGQTSLVSVSSTGQQGNAPSGHPYASYHNSSVSDGGRFVTFQSQASNLVAGDTNGVEDIFVHDRQTGQTTRISVDSASVQANSRSETPSISGDGRLIAFTSYASNLVPGDTNTVTDVFLHDRQTGLTSRVSVSAQGVQAVGHSAASFISENGRYLAFNSDAANLVPGDLNGVQDVFIRNLASGEMSCSSVNSSGRLGTSYSAVSGSIASAEHLVAFFSSAANLVPGDSNGVGDIFVHRGGAVGPRIYLTGACPGGTTVRVLYATPHSFVAMVYGSAGTYVKPGSPCTGLKLNIGGPALHRFILTDAEGGFTIVADLPAAACGLSLQAVDVRTCTLSNVVVL